MDKEEIESRILICEMRERDYREAGNTKTADRYSNEKYKWEKLINKLDPKRDEQLEEYKRGYRNLEQALSEIKEYVNHEYFKRNQLGISNADFQKWQLDDILQIIDKVVKENDK